MKYKAGKVKIKGEEKWAVLAGKQYFTNMVADTQEEAHKLALYASAKWHQQQMDKIHYELKRLGEIDERDPYDYLA